MNIEYPPGPWASYVSDREITGRNDVFEVFDAAGESLVEIGVNGDYDRAEAITNLFAAAPGLLAACERLANLCANCCPQSASGDEAIAEAVAVIRKARGQ